MSINWVMIPEDLSRPFVPLPRERELLASPVRTSFSLKSPKPPASVPASSTTTTTTDDDTAADSVVDISAASGIAYVTTQRVIYLPRPAGTATTSSSSSSSGGVVFRSFSVPLLKLLDTRVTAPFFGPNVLVGAVQPVREGGIATPRHAPYTVELRLTFKDGGAYDFHAKFCEVRERAVQAREIVREIGRNGEHQEVHGEQLPAYEEEGKGEGERASAATATGRQPGMVAAVENASNLNASSSRNGGNTMQPTAANGAHSGPPEEPPPGYEEAVTS